MKVLCIGGPLDSYYYELNDALVFHRNTNEIPVTIRGFDPPPTGAVEEKAAIDKVTYIVKCLISNDSKYFILLSDNNKEDDLIRLLIEGYVTKKDRM